MKKVEVIIEKRYLDEFVTRLEEAGIPGYTIVEITRGFGPTHGKTYDLGFLPLDKHFFVITICNDEEYKILQDKIVPYVKELKGLIYSYDINLL